MTAADRVLRAHLARRAQAPGVALPPPAPPPTLERAAAGAAGRAAEALAGLPLICDSVTVGACSLAELPEVLPERALLAVIEAGDRLGVVALSAGTITSLIEMQAFGKVGSTPPEARRPTRADAALASDFINHMLAGLGQDAQRIAGEEGLAGFRYASHLEDARPLGLMLEDRGFRTLRLALRLGHGGAREGEIYLAMPPTGAVVAHLPRPIAPTPLPPLPPAEASAAPPAKPRKTLALAMRQAPVPLVAVLCRRRISLAELRALTPGAMLALPRQALAEARLETASGSLLARGKLGEAEGFHALRLSDPQAGQQTPIRFGRDAMRPGSEPPMGDLSHPDDFRPEAGAATPPLGRQSP